MRKILMLFVLIFVMTVTLFASGGEEKKDGFIVGISNPWVGSEWRTQMVDDVKKAAEPYIQNGLVKEVIVQSYDVTLEGQIDQIRNLMAKGADLILVNPADVKALNPVIKEAKSQGIIVIATDTEVSSPDAINVAINQTEWAKTSAKWLAEKLGGNGNIVTINGIAGHPANTARVKGYQEVFTQYRGINILNEVNADWENAKGQAAMQSLLATYPNIDGVWVQDGMSQGALQAVLDAKKKIILTGEARVGYLKLWDKVKIDGIGVANPPGCMASAFEVGIQLLQGRTIKSSVLSGPFGNTIYVPIPVVVTNENFSEVFNEYKSKPDYYSVDGYITPDEAALYFE